jgi:hypothetical protein
MRRSLWAILVVLLAGIGAPSARADSPSLQTTTLRCADGCVTLLASPEVSFPSPAVQATSRGYDFSSPFASNWAPTNQYAWEAGGVNSTSNGISYDPGVSIPPTAIAAFGSSDIAECKTKPVITPVPEPSSGILAVSGIAFLFMMRSVFNRRIPA